MDDWLHWIERLVFQPAHDERVDVVQREVDSLKPAIADIKQRAEALEAFERVSGGRQ